MLKQKHQQLYDLLKMEMQQGKWPAESRLPNLREIAAQYSVSINVASQAINLLKAQKMVKVLVGDGIYSTFTDHHINAVKHFAGQRVFGAYVRAKTIRVLIEDYLDSQWEFWKNFYQRFTDENPDIELEVYRQNEDSSVPKADYDLCLGGIQFQVSHGFSSDSVYHRQILDSLGARGLPGVQPEGMRLGKTASECYLPYAAVYSNLFCDQPLPRVLVGENCLDYAERLAGDFNGVYTMRRGLAFLESSGVSFLDGNGDALAMPDKERFMATIGRMRKLYQSGHLTWHHGQIADYENLWGKEHQEQFMVAEIPSNAQFLKRRELHSICVPEGHVLHPILICCSIHRRCPYPEECVRVVQALQMQENQRLLCKCNNVYPVMAEKPGSDTIWGLSFENLPVRTYNDALYKLVEWELMYYLNGRRGDDIYELIPRKIQCFLESKKFCGNNIPDGTK